MCGNRAAACGLTRLPDSTETVLTVTAPDAPRSPAPEPVEVELAAALPPPQHRLAGVVRSALRVVPVLLLIAAAWVLWREFHKLSFEAVAHAIAGCGASSTS
jgi:hypothetical protein